MIVLKMQPAKPGIVILRVILRAPFVLTQDFAKQSPAPILDEKNEPISQGLVLNMIDQRVKKLTPDFASYTIAKMVYGQ